MLYKDICYLGHLREIENEYEDIFETVIYSDDYQFVNTKSIGYRQFYEAQSKGYKPEIILEMSSYSYNMQEHVLYNNIQYEVIRTYQKSLDVIELTLQREANQYKNGTKKKYLDGTFYLDGSSTLDGEC